MGICWSIHDLEGNKDTQRWLNLGGVLHRGELMSAFNVLWTVVLYHMVRTP